jgi:hypothetical protein
LLFKAVAGFSVDPNLGFSDHDIISLYHAHGECEQYHSEVKTDMDLERLPSGKFETNALILELGMIAYNILRMIGQGTIGGRVPRQKREVKRRRLRTVIGNMVMLGLAEKHFSPFCQ